MNGIVWDEKVHVERDRILCNKGFGCHFLKYNLFLTLDMKKICKKKTMNVYVND